MQKLTLYQKFIINQIEIGELHKYLGSIVRYPEKRLRYSIEIDKLKKLDIVIEMSNELTINSSSNFYKSQIYNTYK
jgi:hypothetical protein